MIVYIIVIYMNYYPAKLYFFFQKKEKKARICILYLCFCSKVTREKVYDTKKRKKMTLQNARSSYLLNFRMWFKNGLKAQKLLAQGIALGIMVISKAP